jgi:hypothetical protein
MTSTDSPYSVSITVLWFEEEATNPSLSHVATICRARLLMDAGVVLGDLCGRNLDELAVFERDLESLPEVLFIGCYLSFCLVCFGHSSDSVISVCLIAHSMPTSSITGNAGLAPELTIGDIGEELFKVAHGVINGLLGNLIELAAVELVGFEHDVFIFAIGGE